ncbi:hypothetical protein OXPF_22660 [Oxobacter pfennigii]|uniref:DUF3231 family protein n=1 Tax=Oxobacter pfennigii TaxID=36849 RepID=A0A0P8W7T3_9CLOT|nr:DUF3231 family protein [Oxobacter pfennigii]KPU44099.1 hypothetical protein OXPF_22660 [Oxobacter pfennigii]
MKNKTEIDLIVSEVSGLWNTYISDTMALCMLKHFMSRLKDEEILSVLKHAVDISNGHIQVITDQFNKEGFPIPDGFGDNDVDINAPRLYTDPFYIFYLVNMGQIGMNAYTLILNHIARPDMRDFFSNCIGESAELFNEAVDLLQQQGLYIKAPRLEFSKSIDYIGKQNIHSDGFLGQKRTLLGGEITSVFASLRYNIIGKGLITGFAQVARSKKVSDYFYRGRDLANKKIKILTNILIEDDIPIPSTSDSFVTDSTIAPFSDKLMLNHISMLYAAKISQDGMSLPTVMRHDLQSYYIGSIAEVSKYAEDGLDILIENKWMEQPPQIIKSENLVKS